MRVTDLKNILSDFYDGTTIGKAILIDGKWGCGKTYQIKEFIKNKEKKCFYISLFGLESLDEINTKLFNLVHPGQAILQKGKNIVSKAITAIPNIGGVGNALDYVMTSKSIKPKKIKYIIFDDLERLTDKISYIDLLGYFNDLFLSNVKIICCISLNDFTDNQKNKKNEFIQFREKVFDYTYTINETDLTIYKTLFSNVSDDIIVHTLDIFKHNLRQAQRTQSFIFKINDYMSKKKVDKDSFDYDEEDVFVAAATTINIVIYNHENVTIKDSISLKEYYEDIFDTNIVKGLYEFFGNDNPVFSNYQSQYLRKLVEAFLFIYMFNDFTYFDKLFVKPGEEKIYDREFFFLSQNNKEEYFNFINNYDFKSEQVNKKIYNMFRNIIKYSNYVFNEDFIENLSQYYFLENKDKATVANLDVYSFFYDSSEIPDNRRQYVVEIIDKIKTNIENYQFIYYTQLIQKLYDSMSYKLLEDLLFKFENSYLNHLTSKLIDFIIKNNYFMIDLSKDITDQEWGYCHQMSSFIKYAGNEEEFKNYIISVCRENKDDTLFSRYAALLKYKCNLELNKKDIVSD